MSSMRAECDCVFQYFYISVFSSTFKCEIYSEPWFQKCPKLTITQAERKNKKPGQSYLKDYFNIL